MAFCEKCGAQIPENGTFCAACGAPVAAQAQPTRTPEQPAAQPQAPEQQPQPPVYPQQPVYQQPVYPQQPVYDPADHTAEFDPEDVSQNKVIAMAAYILGTVGIIIALLAAPQSKYAAFHSRQALKLDIVSTLLLIVSAVLAFTFLRRAHHLLLPGMQRQSKGRCHHRQAAVLEVREQADGNLG